MKSQSNKVQSACDVKVYSDKGSLALRFPLRHNALWEALDGKSLKGKPKCLGIGKYGFSADNSNDWKRASAIASQLESDLDHPEWDKLFDRTLAKYGLGGGKYAKLADIIQLPGTVPCLPEITVGAMWEDYLQWKKTVVEETTFKSAYGKYSNAVCGRVWNKKTNTHTQLLSPLANVILDNKNGIDNALAEIEISNKANLLVQLSKAFESAEAKGLIVNPTTRNPFDSSKYAIPLVTTQQKYADKVVNGVTVEWHETDDEKSLELDRRAFTKQECISIVKAFYESDRQGARRFAPLIEFYFLTGCRTSEAFVLTWKDVDLNRNLIRFSKSLGRSTKKVKTTKTGEARLFYFGENSRLKALLLEIKGNSSVDLVFPGTRNKFIVSTSINDIWRDNKYTRKCKDGTEVEYFYPGVVSQLVRDGKISGYLSPYHCRHTYITLTAQANGHNTDALLHIASACGNSVDVILRHYLGRIDSTEILEF